MIATVMASGDHHFQEGDRFDECKRIHRFVADEVERRRPALFLSAGDVFDRASTPTERLAAADFFAAVASVCPVVVVRGNHDRRLDCRIFDRIRAAHPVIVEEHAAVHVIAGIAVGAVAWPNRAAIAAMTGRPIGGAALDVVAHEQIVAVLGKLGEELARHEGPRVVVGHFMVDGAAPSIGQPLQGQPISVTAEDLVIPGAPLVICGHIHRGQEWRVGDVEIAYTGSPYRTSFGETDDKSVILASFDGPRLAGWSRIATPARRMILLDATWSDRLDAEIPDGIEDADVRLRYHVPDEQRGQAREAARDLVARLRTAGAHVPDPEERVIATARARAPRVAAASTLPDKIAASWEARGKTVAEPQRSRVLGLAAEIESA